MASHTNPLVVLGAGVLGLTTALTLQTRFPGRKITIVARELPLQIETGTASASYASAWAGAHYRPIFPSTEQLKQEAEFARQTYRIMKRISQEVPEAGVGIMQGVEYFAEGKPKGMEGMREGDEYAGEGDGFRILERGELVEGVEWGCEYTTYCVNPVRYCQYLMERFLGGGGRVESLEVSGPEQLFDTDLSPTDDRVQVVINCSGTNFGVDPKVKLIRGQGCLVRNEYHRTVTRQYADGRWAAIIPRPGGEGTFVGVSKEIGDEEEKPRAETRRLLLEQCLETCPNFVTKMEDFDVIRDTVGRRPLRDGGLRIETEHFSDYRTVVHGYGAGGRGYELSWGVAEKLADLVWAADSR